MDQALFTPQPGEIQDLLNDVDKTGQAFLAGQNAARTGLIAKARSLIAALESPVESITWMAWAEPSRQAALRIAIDLGLFDHLLANDGCAKTRNELASSADADSKLIGRVLKHLASTNVIKEVDVDTYAPTRLARVLTVPEHKDAFPFCSEAAGPVFQRLPAYFAERGYVSPSNIRDGPFQYGQNTDLPVWQCRMERPRIEQAFNNHMAGYHQGRPSWMDEGFYPFKDQLMQGVRSGQGEVSIVDVGGNVGYDLRELKRKVPSFPGRLVLQDRPATIESVVDVGDGIEAMSHDFFTAQPVKGARAYYMHSVLHDWSDADCRRILTQIVAAMEKGYSKLLINENIVPDSGADWRITSLDWFMMTLAASAERTETEWKELIQSVGLTVVGIWTTDSAVESLIEAVLYNA